MTVNFKTLRRTAFATALASAALMAFPMAAVADQAAGSQDELVEAARNPAVPDADFDFIVPRTEDNIARLGDELTPMGSLKAGNEGGTIHEWTGLGRDDWPAGFEPGDRHHDPFADDEPLFTLTSDND